MGTKSVNKKKPESLTRETPAANEHNNKLSNRYQLVNNMNMLIVRLITAQHKLV